MKIRIRIMLIYVLVFALLLIPLIWFTIREIFTIKDVVYKVMNTICLILEVIVAFVSLFIIFRELQYNNFCKWNQVNRSIKKITDFLTKYEADYVIYAGKNSSELMKMIKNTISSDKKYKEFENKIEYMYIELKHKFKDGVFTNFDFQTSRFYATYDKIPTKLDLSGKRVIIFDDIIKTGELVQKIKSELINRFNANENNISVISYGVYTPTYCIKNTPEMSVNFFNSLNNNEYSFPWRKENEK